MQLTKTEAEVLVTLTGGRELYGLEMVKASGQALKLGSIYVLLGRLEDKGLVESRKEQSTDRVVPRRYYNITGAGVRALQAREAAIIAINGVYQGAAA